jgi:predicted kinase
MRTLYILIGIPNSGKSTWTKATVDSYLKDGHTVSVHSTDNYFMVEDQYVFNPACLGRYHAANLAAAKASMNQGHNVVIIDNTNLKPRDYTPYVEYGKSKGYDVILQRFFVSLELALERNTKRHAETGKLIPIDVMKRMHEEFSELPA